MSSAVLELVTRVKAAVSVEPFPAPASASAAPLSLKQFEGSGVLRVLGRGQGDG
jgi:hypothetical protein